MLKIYPLKERVMATTTMLSMVVKLGIFFNRRLMLDITMILSISARLTPQGHLSFAITMILGIYFPSIHNRPLHTPSF